MHHILRRIIIATLAILFMAPASVQAARIKDMVEIEGVRDNMLVGYGLVVGLNGTGDSLGSSPFTQQSLVGMLERLGVNIRNQSLKTKNVAAVVVTATLPPFATQGKRIDVTVATLGDAKSLLGGTLLVTPLMGADGEVYAVAQGAAMTSGFAAEGQGGSVVKNVPTTARMPDGAIIERELDFSLNDMPRIRLSLRNPDFTTAQRMAQAINKHFGNTLANAPDPANIVLDMSQTGMAPAALLASIESLQVTPDQMARIVIDDKAGVIVMGENVRISTVAIAQGNLTIRITEMPETSQPAPFSNTGSTVTNPRTSIGVEDNSSSGNGKVMVMTEAPNLHQLVEGLNTLGVSPRDIISILQSIKAAGALQADIEVL
ncbi:MAG TPA: flagellar biosynthesis protein FlgA [Rhodospirillaceae bacterium]|nr:MAG: flagellar biosynthesis protein FlgA [Alphaproteobacteria bacterium GWF2_58_20]HAU29089.1 flagellar biosynthesis protein FlgA [Rhodospirillaceae bacterium]